jgi:hypothetical protein
MVGTPNTWGVVLLLAVVFVGCILWATRGSAKTHHSEEEEVQQAGKSS